MLIQSIIVGLIIAAAVVYGVVTLSRKRSAFSTKPGCGSDCGCNSGGKKLPS
ncbi:MAG: FeoB-associated Cys-rich membrane protein [Acidobacteria bacterium]|jgi:hypothetical protein|nr:FeoB-associated Cys-rich membrane protein [Acidobacteriota bacterium]MBP7476422.1 FeoB-associated Cys-rich membrane protein [Pyrinomonadaceae bacterium]MBP9110527.1 FeoB-associated Cys-rich membrane protein [Pyrinomonadaceae bacterium]